MTVLLFEADIFISQNRDIKGKYMDSQFSQLIQSAEICGEILSKSRVKAGLSRREMSERLGFSESTIKGWEAGLGSPTLSVLIDWFIETGCNLYKSLLDFLWPDYFFKVNETSSNETLQKAIQPYFEKVAGNLEIKRIHYLVFNNDFEKWNKLLELFFAFAQLPLYERYRIAELNRTAYKICKANGTLHTPDFELNNHSLETKAAIAAKEAVMSGKSGYMVGFYDLSSDKVAAQIMKKARSDSNVSVAEMAKAMSKSSRTIQNWEVNGQPSFLEMNKWFNVLNKSMWFYLRNCITPYESTEIDQSTDCLRAELVQHFLTAPPREARVFSYYILGEYGSYYYAVLELIMKYEALPVSMRALIAHSIILGYELHNSKSVPESDSSVHPDLKQLKKTLEETLNEMENKTDKVDY